MAKRIGIISDTHNLLRPEVLEILKGCDCILHAGDVTKESLLDQIRFLGNLYVVRGNNDGDWARGIAKVLTFQIEGVSFVMAHEWRHLIGQTEGTNVAVFGHTHKYFAEQAGHLLWLNPGSCGYPRFGGAVTMVVMEVDGAEYYVEKIDFSSGITYAGLLNECEEAFYMLCEGVRQSLAEVSECIWPLAVSHAAAECGVLLPH